MTLNIGFGNVVVREKVSAVLMPDSLPIKRLIAAADKNGKLLNATMGKKVRAVVVMESGEIVLSAISADTIINRLEEKGKN